MPTPPRNPYIAGKALGDSRGFFGREDVFRIVETVLSSPDQNSVVLSGQRRIGKTSILLNLCSRLSSRNFVPVYFDLMDRARKSLAQVSFELAATIAQELKLPQPERADFDEEGRGFREKFLPTVYNALRNDINDGSKEEALILSGTRATKQRPESKIRNKDKSVNKKNRRLVLLFDEFDVLNVGTEEKLTSTSAALAFFPYLRDLMTNETRLGFVFVVGRKMEQLSIEFISAFKASRSYRVSVLDGDSASELVHTAERDHLLRFGEEAITRVLELTACHPYLTQLTCQLLFEQAYQTKSTRKTITRSSIDKIVPKVLEAGEPQFEWIWDALPPAERVIFSAIASGTDEQTVITEERLISILKTQGIRILIKELDLAPKTLVEWEMLKLTNGGYKFFVELLRRWVVERKPLDKVKDELDRIAPLADTLYQGANGFYRRGDLEHAITQLQSALDVNPNHLKARLLLGEIYRAQDRLDDAVRELEEAHKIDEDSTRIALEMVLIQRAGKLEKQTKLDDALKDYKRVFLISPNNATVQEKILAIERALGQQEAKKLAASAEQDAHIEKWEEAIAKYERVMELDPQTPQWRDALEKEKKGRDIARRYAEALGAAEQRRWSESQRALADVIYSKPDYKDAASKLVFVNAQLAPKTDQPISSIENNRLAGIVKWFNVNLGYGFITYDIDKDAFVHYSEIQMDGYKALDEGDSVEFSVEDTPKGPQAVNVTKLASSISARGRY